MAGDIPVWLGVVLTAAAAALVGLLILGSISRHTRDVLGAIRKNASGTVAPAQAAQEPALAAHVAQEIPNRGALVAAASACIATVLGTEPAGLRIVSIKKVG